MILRSFNSSAFSLAEVTVALSVAAFALIAIFGLLPVGLDTTQTAIGQTAANGIISAVIADLKATRPGAEMSDRFGISLPTDSTDPSNTELFFDAEGMSARDLQPDSRFRLEIKFLPAEHKRAPVQALLQITWPAAAAEIKTAQGSVSVFSAISRN
jgi:uncharacterized protein (TIGR02598 family)